MIKKSLEHGTSNFKSRFNTKIGLSALLLSLTACSDNSGSEYNLVKAFDAQKLQVPENAASIKIGDIVQLPYAHVPKTWDNTPLLSSTDKPGGIRNVAVPLHGYFQDKSNIDQNKCTKQDLSDVRDFSLITAFNRDPEAQDRLSLTFTEDEIVICSLKGTVTNTSEVYIQIQK